MITGHQWRLFFQEFWPDEWYIDDIGVPFEDEDGNYILPDSSVHRLGDFGCVGEHTKQAGQLVCVSVLYNKVMNPLQKNSKIIHT